MFAMRESKNVWRAFAALLLCILSNTMYVDNVVHEEYKSVLGDPGMKSEHLRVGLEEWNFCNEVGYEAPCMGSPRQADCADISCTDTVNDGISGDNRECMIDQKVTEADNKLGFGDPFPNSIIPSPNDTNAYAAAKEVYLGSLCEVHVSGNQWQFWMIMLKNGNFDTKSGLCPENGKMVSPIRTNRTFPCFGEGCMNQPIVYHNWTSSEDNGFSLLASEKTSITGAFYGTYDLNASLESGIDNISFFSVVWERNCITNKWVFRHKLKTSRKYPWLMLYLRADVTRGLSGGYHYDGRGIMMKAPESPNFKVRITLDILRGGGKESQFYLIDIGSCWKNDGHKCNGNVTSDVTRYSEMIINPDVTSSCKPYNLASCPPYHITCHGTKIYRNDTLNFPYSAYHLYCAPGNAKFLEEPYDICDPYSNPQPQELVQLLPHPEWGVHGFPSHKGAGWIGDPRTWELDVGALSSRLYFYQDPGTAPAKRIWLSINVGTEVYITEKDETAEWSVSDFDVTVPATSF
eukprot:TRINITY_DN29117_c0_g1_i1.p1 TRINITY_DN29117_c0_g1~~TRINITY_DN29117_c0_g1_i1.p1  ORF type:complete len:518 (-),score=74.88 TRINITY_DN29117_c0_g1_i1:219-1772(-)